MTWQPHTDTPCVRACSICLSIFGLDGRAFDSLKEENARIRECVMYVSINTAVERQGSEKRENQARFFFFIEGCERAGQVEVRADGRFL